MEGIPLYIMSGVVGCAATSATPAVVIVPQPFLMSAISGVKWVNCWKG